MKYYETHSGVPRCRWLITRCHGTEQSHRCNVLPARCVVGPGQQRSTCRTAPRYSAQSWVRPRIQVHVQEGVGLWMALEEFTGFFALPWTLSAILRADASSSWRNRLEEENSSQFGCSAVNAKSLSDVNELFFLGSCHVVFSAAICRTGRPSLLCRKIHYPLCILL